MICRACEVKGHYDLVYGTWGGVRTDNLMMSQAHYARTVKMWGHCQTIVMDCHRYCNAVDVVAVHIHQVLTSPRG